MTKFQNYKALSAVIMGIHKAVIPFAVLYLFIEVWDSFGT